MNELSLKARQIIEERLARAAKLTEFDMFTANLKLPKEHKYQSVREIQTVLLKGAFDGLGFSVELGLFSQEEATAYWQELHSRYASLWPDK